MGKYIRKTRSGAGEMTQGHLGVRTRARVQAMQELVRKNSNDEETSASTPMHSFAPVQVSYLELRSRKLEKVVGCIGNKPPTARKSATVAETRKLSDVTNSDILAEASYTRRSLSSHRLRRNSIFNENQDYLYHFHGENDIDVESSLRGFVRRSLQQGSSRGQGAPGIGHSRSNSRSNSVTRELPVPRETPSRGILTRNQKKLESQSCNKNVEISCGENVIEDSSISVRSGEDAPEISARFKNAMASDETVKTSSKCKPGLQEDASLSSLRSSLGMEIEDFFSQAERELQRNFIKRYNFDPMNDTPLPGRYEWVQV
ncbi:hypothetical protein KP509_14G025100 [Ceratopteris richardii]|uniref:Cyclin-dependent kinase inhibitor domain-containing protein n=2 Tax=Ceratopteris richardii TaxID=49495 RepID=A0A8T2T889_CERRI|nr:hypothetical protein KP509_14G025100 [Ceratopteris richardii]